MSYQALIHEINPGLNPAGVEASMRLEHGTLEHLSRETIVHEVRIAADMERLRPGCLRIIADSFGLVADFDRWACPHDNGEDLAGRCNRCGTPQPNE